MTQGFSVDTIELDVPALAAAFGRRLYEAGVPVTPEREVTFARALTLTRPVSRRRLYCAAHAVFVSDQAHMNAFDAVFGDVFGFGWTPADGVEVPPSHTAGTESAPADARSAEQQRSSDGPPADGSQSLSPRSGTNGEEPELDVPVPTVASADEVLRSKHFDALEPFELAQLYRLMTRLTLATPRRRTRRYERGRGHHVDLRRTLRGSLRTAGEPVRLAHRRRRVEPRRLVMLCDISGSMEPYARAYLQFLTCAAGSGPDAEAFVFATRLTRLTRALGARHPERAIQRAAAAAPDWSSGTRIGDALKAFNDRHGRRGMARGAVVVILSDGWERADPGLVGREMERLARLAHRIVWVNPRVSADRFAVRAAGMVAALPHCDALVSGHSFEALTEVAEAIGAATWERGDDFGAPPAGAPGEPEPWASATPVPGSSVAMPSGHGPSRGNTTGGWVTDDDG
jgi:uncharacterized protein